MGLSFGELRRRHAFGWCGALRKDGAVGTMARALKQELVHRCDFETRAEARSEMFEYIEVFYNRWRRYSYLGYMSPADFEAPAVTTASGGLNRVSTISGEGHSRPARLCGHRRVAG